MMVSGIMAGEVEVERIRYEQFASGGAFGER